MRKGRSTEWLFFTIPNNYRGITPDIYIFAIDNYVDEQKVEAAIATGAKVLLFFRSHHDDKNTIESEVSRIQEFRAKVQGGYDCFDYTNNAGFEQCVTETLTKVAKN